MKRKAFRARKSERPRPPDRGGGAERSHFHSPVPCPAAAALPQGNTPAPTERVGLGEGARGGRGEPKTPQAPSGGGMSKRGTLRGTTVISFGSFSGGLRFVCVCTCVSDGATHKKAGGSSNQNTQVGRPLSKHYVSGDTTAMKTLTEKKSKKKLSAARVESFSYTGGIALKFVLTYGGILKGAFRRTSLELKFCRVATLCLPHRFSLIP